MRIKNRYGFIGNCSWRNLCGSGCDQHNGLQHIGIQGSQVRKYGFLHLVSDVWRNDYFFVLGRYDFLRKNIKTVDFKHNNVLCRNLYVFINRKDILRQAEHCNEQIGVIEIGNIIHRCYSSLQGSTTHDK